MGIDGDVELAGSPLRGNLLGFNVSEVGLYRRRIGGVRCDWDGGNTSDRDWPAQRCEIGGVLMRR